EIIETNRGAVLRIGSRDVELTPDEYLYEIRYRVNRVVSYLNEHDRLIWNVNGNEGHFSIEALSVRVALPEGAAPLAVEVYTGRYGEDGKDRSEEHTSELQSREKLVCRLLLKKKKQPRKH